MPCIEGGSFYHPTPESSSALTSPTPAMMAALETQAYSPAPPVSDVSGTRVVQEESVPSDTRQGLSDRADLQLGRTLLEAETDADLSRAHEFLLEFAERLQALGGKQSNVACFSLTPRIRQYYNSLAPIDLDHAIALCEASFSPIAEAMHQLGGFRRAADDANAALSELRRARDNANAEVRMLHGVLAQLASSIRCIADYSDGEGETIMHKVGCISEVVKICEDSVAWLKEKEEGRRKQEKRQRSDEDEVVAENMRLRTFLAIHTTRLQALHCKGEAQQELGDARPPRFLEEAMSLCNDATSALETSWVQEQQRSHCEEERAADLERLRVFIIKHAVRLSALQGTIEVEPECEICIPPSTSEEAMAHCERTVSALEEQLLAAQAAARGSQAPAGSTNF